MNTCPRKSHFIKDVNPKECFKEKEITGHVALKSNAHIFG